MRFNDAKNLGEPVMFENRKFGFSEKWMVVVLAMGLPEDSPFRNLDQIPYPEPPPPITQNPITIGADDEDIPSMRELMGVIDSHAELIDLEITSNPSIVPISA